MNNAKKACPAGQVLREKVMLSGDREHPAGRYKLKSL